MVRHEGDDLCRKEPHINSNLIIEIGVPLGVGILLSILEQCKRAEIVCQIEGFIEMIVQNLDLSSAWLKYRNW
jgi:hypothetical protein